jgi:hypothetical protein
VLLSAAFFLKIKKPKKKIVIAILGGPSRPSDMSQTNAAKAPCPNAPTNIVIERRSVLGERGDTIFTSARGKAGQPRTGDPSDDEKAR